MITAITLIFLAAIGIILYQRHNSLKPMTEQDVRELHQKFKDDFKNVEPEPKLEFHLNKKRHPSSLYLSQGHNVFLMLAWDNTKTPSIKKYSRDPKHYNATHQFLERFNVKPPQ